MSAMHHIEAFRTFLGKCERQCTWAGRKLTLTTSHALSLADLESIRGCIYDLQFADSGLGTNYAMGRITEVVAGTSITLEVKQDPTSLIIVKSFDDLVNLPGAATNLPSGYVIYDSVISISFDGVGEIPSSPKLVGWYHDALRLWNALKLWADHNQNDEVLLYFGIRRTALEAGFSSADLRANEINEIVQFQNESDKRDARKEIFKAVLSEHLRDQTSERAFLYLLKSTGLFAQRLREALRIYHSQHAPEKLQKEAEKQVIEFSEKIDKVVGGIEAKSLTIPAALLVAYKEVEAHLGFTMANTITLLAGILYLIAMVWSSWTQTEVLKHLRTAVEQAAQEASDKGLDSRNKVIERLFPFLITRIKSARIAGICMGFAALLPHLCISYQMNFGGGDERDLVAVEKKR